VLVKLLGVFVKVAHFNAGNESVLLLGFTFGVNSKDFFLFVVVNDRVVS
jgi:hypothetical protein